jgi:hypothetical protein
LAKEKKRKKKNSPPAKHALAKWVNKQKQSASLNPNNPTSE